MRINTSVVVAVVAACLSGCSATTLPGGSGATTAAVSTSSAATTSSAAVGQKKAATIVLPASLPGYKSATTPKNESGVSMAFYQNTTDPTEMISVATAANPGGYTAGVQLLTDSKTYAGGAITCGTLQTVVACLASLDGGFATINASGKTATADKLAAFTSSVLGAATD